MFVKVIANRIAGYIGLVNIFLLLFLTLSNLKQNGYINLDIGKSFIPIYFVFIIILFVIGWIEIHILKGQYREAEIQNSLVPSHPDIQDIKLKLNEMYDYIKEQEGGAISQINKLGGNIEQ
jgi:hypothetical protein